MQTLAQIRELLDQAGASPKRSLGQNFLLDHNLIRKLVNSAYVGPGDVVLEIGPGTGTMTEELLRRGASVIACELDDTLAAIVRERFDAQAKAGRFTLVHGDCLARKRRLNLEAARVLGGRGFKLVANLPYGAGTPLMLALLMEHPECAVLAVTVQREVADRVLAGPGSKDFGGLSVIAQATCEGERVATAPPECFWPRPDVTSAMLVLRRRPAPLTKNLPGLSGLCRVLLGSRRKQIGSLLTQAAKRAGVTIDLERALNEASAGSKRTPLAPTLRAEQMDVPSLIGLLESLERQGLSFVDGTLTGDSET